MAGAAAAVICTMVLSVVAPPAASASSAPGPDAVQQGLNVLVRSDGVPGALASVTNRGGRARTYTAGVGDRATGAKVPRDGQVRIGSNTKPFTAVVMLQLVGEGKIRLDGPVETYLPGLVRGEGIDGRRITVRQLLQHTSGLPDYEDDVTDDILERRYLEPRDALDVALRHEADFAPGTKWAYSNTNYLVAGLIVQRVTGRPLAEEIDKRVIRRIGLRHTYFPAPGETTIRERHAKGYRKDGPGAPLRDVTEIDPSAAWAAGAMVSTTSDLNRFFSALLNGRLLPKAQLDQMRTTVPIDTTNNVRSGLGLISWTLSCGGVYWGHNGGIPGYGTWGGATDDGRAAEVTMTVDPTSGPAAMERVASVVDKALCR
ncbi:serine hydrolase domain-containing protein [Streptomyces sp. CC224B]|uniref:serine hydrolase domain-containing protein n=1 Tax=Streptomyces sp. CC224B TaxID=3044571 RepID=UPI0024A7B0A0|nr:serine hydrolase domain-containing protein [Streptomyces sp. CC224B]